MLTLGLDIGTTSLAGVVVDVARGKLLATLTAPNDAGLPARRGQPLAAEQDAGRILERTEAIRHRLLRRFPRIAAIGVTGQMHGILYTDRRGAAVSPLYTWQDRRGEEIYRRKTSFVDFLRERTGRSVATGYGTVTHFVHRAEKSVPRRAVALCTIGDYVAMRLARRTRPATDVTNAAGLGLFDVRRGRYDEPALAAAGLDPEFFPPVVPSFEPLGETADGRPVFPALGDNQASFLGAVADRESTVLLNVGTGSQVCAYTTRFPAALAADVRPFPGGGYLCVGASLFGGRAYAMLKRFFGEVCRSFGKQPPRDGFAVMNRLAEEAGGVRLRVDPRFVGTREEPSLRGSITEIGPDNFTPGTLAAGFTEGIIEELHASYQRFPAALRGKIRRCVGSGNGLRRHPFMRACCRRRFAMDLLIPEYQEEAAYGAALAAARGVGAVDAGRI